MATSRKASTTYSRSSFDAIESTRRLSDGMSGKANTGDDHRSVAETNGVLGEDLYRSLRLQNFNSTNDATGIHGLNTSNYNNNNNMDTNDKNDGARKDSNTSNEGGFTSSSLGSIAKERSSNENKDNTNSDDNVIASHGELHDKDDAGDDNYNDNNNIDQRSESDSDLESPDDFNGDDYVKYETFERIEHMKVNVNLELEDNTNAPRNETKDIHSYPAQTLTNRIIARSNIITSSDIENSNNENVNVNSSHIPQSTHQIPQEENKLNVSNKTDDKEVDDFKMYSPRGSKAKVKSDDSYSKIHDNDNVLDHIEKLDEVKDIGFTNMDKLQHIDKSDPALRRLFMRPRVTPAETQSVKVDPDIKSMVNEFLKTNVAENFIITRVLRENYALFYAWLASHMQTERNAWAVRLGQALENAEKERKGSMGSRSLVLEAATRLRALVATVSGSLYGVQDTDRHQEKQNNDVFRKGRSLRHGHVKGFTNQNGLKGGGGGAKRTTNDRNVFDRIGIKNNDKCNLQVNDSNYVSDSDMDDVSAMLRQSSFNMIQVCEPDNYESDPGTGKKYYDMKRRLKSQSHCTRTNLLKQSAKSSNGIGNILNHKHNDQKFSKSPNLNSSEVTQENDSMPFGYTINGTMVDYDDDTDWKRVLTDSIDVLVEICDAFLTDRRACLRLISSKSSQYESLVDALSNFIQDNQSRDYFKRKEIEKRLRILEMENKSMQDEMTIMKKTLMDKSEDALNLQTHLSRLEAAMTSQKAEKVDKCVGTKRDEFGSPRVHLVVGGKQHVKTSTSKSRSPHDNQKQNKGYKITKSPYAAHDPLGVVNGKSPLKTTVTVPNVKNSDRNGYASDTDETSYDYKGGVTHENEAVASEEDPPLGVQRQQSFIEISEEKLEKLKHRAKKLEDSLHEAISSMDTLNRSTPWMDKLKNDTTDKPVPSAYLQRVKVAGNHHQTARNIAYWKKSSFDIKNYNNNSYNRQRFVGTITKPGFDPYRRPKDPNPSEIEINLRSENSSLLEGRSIVEQRWEKDQPNTVSNLKLVSDRSQGLTPRSTAASRFDGYQSDDDRASTRTQTSHVSQQNELNTARSETQTHSHKVRARRGQVKQIVSKCLRCQKLFTPTDNHKLACCYHTKDKERLEHYDHMGMLVKVIYAWKCCHQPQEADGCSFGKHI